MTVEIKKTKTTSPKEKPDENNLGFGKIFTDHMFIMENENGKWINPRIEPYHSIEMDPATIVLHYAQMMFEGMKAYKTDKGVNVFRPDMNAKRLNKTNKRMCIPEMDIDLFVECIKAFVDYERDWVPKKEGTSLYLRPFIIADEVGLGAHSSNHFTFYIIASPVGAYYAANNNGLTANKLLVQDEFIRAAVGGTGFAKVGGNYAGGLKGKEMAIKEGCSEVLWLDAKEKKYVEEAGTSNAFFMINDEVITAPLGGSILPGVTRDSAICLMKKWGVKVVERKLSIEEISKASKDGSLKEAFATGTACVISPIGCLKYKGEDIVINNGEVGELSNKLYDTIYGMQTGKIEDDMGWIISL